MLLKQERFLPPQGLAAVCAGTRVLRTTSPVMGCR